MAERKTCNGCIQLCHMGRDSDGNLVDWWSTDAVVGVLICSLLNRQINGYRECASDAYKNGDNLLDGVEEAKGHEEISEEASRCRG